VFERFKLPLTKWWMAVHMMNSGKNGVSAHEIHRQLGVTYKTAWFMMHRLREAMIVSEPGPMGAGGGNVQADETYHLNTSKRAKGYKRGHSNRRLSSRFSVRTLATFAPSMSKKALPPTGSRNSFH
jgi:hypothetical protein